MLGEVADLFQVGQHGVRCEVAHRHVVDHSLTQGRNPAGDKTEVVNRCDVAHGEQQYRKSPPLEGRPTAYKVRNWSGTTGRDNQIPAKRVSTISHCANLVTIVMPGDCQDRNGDLLIIFRSWRHGIPVSI